MGLGEEREREDSEDGEMVARAGKLVGERKKGSRGREGEVCNGVRCGIECN